MCFLKGINSLIQQEFIKSNMTVKKFVMLKISV